MPDRQMIENLRDGQYKKLGILRPDNIQMGDTKNKVKNEYYPKSARMKV